MKAHVPFLGVSLLLFVLSGAAQSVAPSLEDALSVFRNGRVIVEYSEVGRAHLNEVIDTLKIALGVPDTLDEMSERDVQAFRLEFGREDLAIRLSQCYFTLAVVFMKGEAGEADIYRKGKHWGLKVLRSDPEFAAGEATDGFLSALQGVTDVPSLYWTCLNWLSVANFNPMEAVMGGIPTKTIAMLERVLELDAAYDCYGAYRILGSVWGALPRLPFGALRKDLEQARFYLCHVVEDLQLCGDLEICPVDPICAEYLGNRRVLAEYYLMEKGMWEDAARVLQSVLDAPIGSAYPLYNARAHEDAREMLERVKQHL